MIFNGILEFNIDGHYYIYNKDKIQNNCLENILSNLYKEEKIIHIQIINDDKIIFNETGAIEYRNDLGGRLYRLWIGNKCLDDILWDNINNNVRIEINEIIDNIERDKLNER